MLLKHVLAITQTKRYNLFCYFVFFNIQFLGSRFLNRCNCAENQFGLASLFAPYSVENQMVMTTWPIWDWECYQCTPKTTRKVFLRSGIFRSRDCRKITDHFLSMWTYFRPRCRTVRNFESYIRKREELALHVEKIFSKSNIIVYKNFSIMISFGQNKISNLMLNQ